MHDARRNVFLAIVLLGLIWISIPALKRQTIASYTETGSTMYNEEPIDIDGEIAKEPETHDAITQVLVEGKEKATLLMLARNSDLEGAVASMKRLEARFNHKYNYPWTFLNDVDFSEEFKTATTQVASGKTEYATIPVEDWKKPSGINEEQAKKNAQLMYSKDVPYAMSESYRQMCRFNSGYFYRQEILKQYDWYWRVEPDVEYFCDLDYDPFTFMRIQNKVYGFVIAITDLPSTVTTLWPTSRRFFDNNTDLVASNNSMNFILDGNKNGPYNLCHFWSNFEIASLNWFRGSAYQKYFEYLDAAGGFFEERWGDAPVHSIAASVMLDKDQLHRFEDIGYRHAPYWRCATNPLPGKCSCPQVQASEMADDRPGLTCLPNWLNNMNKPAQVW